MTRNRKTAKERYSHLYRLAPSERSDTAFRYAMCVYCGDPADTVDHVPPLSRVDDYRSLGPCRERYLLVKSCSPCNAPLGDSVQASLLERVEYLKERLSARLPKRRARWTEEDIQRLGRNLRSLVASQVDKQTKLEARISYVGGLRALLGYTGEERVIDEEEHEE